MVLLTGLTVAFFSRAIISRQVSNSSANQTRVDLFARGAVQTIISDLKQEIASGSDKPPATPPPGVRILYPKVPATSIPQRVATDAALPNLVKRSASGQPFFSGSDYEANYPASNRAANLPTTRSSQNGRVVSLARWNAHFLLPKQNPDSDTDLTPHEKFVAPDWVLVARDGSNPKAVDKNVVGRYAYAIYDEGGLLDMNVAGFPASPAPSGPQKAYAARKGALAFADLTRIPTDPADPDKTLSQEEVNQIVGWRNYASSQASGTLPEYSFSAAGVASYHTFALLNRKGFMLTGHTTLQSAQSDRIFTTRQSLVDLLLRSIAPSGSSGAETRAGLQNALQYLATFTRDLNQPSVTPAADRPKVIANGGNNGAGG
ncbi:MAG: hypothetical protein M3463_12165, partial [Verrucomicrobiota bacterium]|nr:hypothetical protein [Verrucomicrobiota bacterium]